MQDASKPNVPQARPGSGSESQPLPDRLQLVGERGARGAVSENRVFMQLLAFTNCTDTQALVEAVKASGLDAVVYESLNDPMGVAIVVCSQSPDCFVDQVRPMVLGQAFESLGLIPLPEYTMFGRSYSIGYEPDLDETLMHRPRRHLFEPDWPWAIWYPLRRAGAFEQLSREEQMGILREHGEIGFKFGQAGLASDVRLACQGLDTHDNDFVIGLMGKELAPLSVIVQAMRKTKQTSMYLENLGPFWIGRAVYKASVQTPPAPEYGPPKRGA